MADKDSHSTDTSVSGAVKKVILVLILVFTHTFLVLIVGYGLLITLQNCRKMRTNLTFVVQFAYFCIRLNKGREQQRQVLFFPATFEQLSLQKATFDFFGATFEQLFKK